MADFDQDSGEEEVEMDVVILVDEDGNEKEFVIVHVLPHKGKDYAILEPVESLDADESEIVAMLLGVDEEGDETLIALDDATYDEVFNAYLKHLDSVVAES